MAAAPPPPEARRDDRLFDEAARYASVAVTLGASREEALSTFESAWRSLADGNPEGEVG